MYATDPEGYLEYMKELERRGKEVVPSDMTDEDAVAQMEVYMKALRDHDPELFKNSVDIERMKKSYFYMSKVQVGQSLSHTRSNC